MSASHLAVPVVAAVLAMVGATPTAAVATPAALIVADPEVVAIDAPAPGDERTWRVVVQSVATSDTTVTVTITGESDRLFAGATPLELALVDDTSGATIVDAPLDRLLDGTVAVGTLSAGARLDLVALVRLPIEAGNDYQGASGELRLRFHAVAAASTAMPSTGPVEPILVAAPGEPALARTGSLAPIAPLLAAVALVLAGAAALVVRRRRLP